MQYAINVVHDAVTKFYAGRMF